MINIKRLPCPDILKLNLDPKTDGEEETRDAILFFSIEENLSLKYVKTGKKGKRIKESYSVYSDKAIRDKLVEMFHGKCAYCESKITTIYSGDIEHFRPKGGHCNDNKQKLTKPGYFWLAAEWDNLLFACPFCNQTYTHQYYEKGKIKKNILGKLNQFPLLSETHRLNYNHGLIYFSDTTAYQIAFQKEESERLLLNPCVDDDIEAYFTYNDEGLILSNDTIETIKQTKAKTSIKVYALQRIALVQAREAKIIKIKAQIRRVEEAIINYNRHFNDSEEIKGWFEGILRKEMTILKRFQNSNREYAGLARFIIKKYFDGL